MDTRLFVPIEIYKAIKKAILYIVRRIKNIIQMKKIILPFTVFALLAVSCSSDSESVSEPQLTPEQIEATKVIERTEEIIERTTEIQEELELLYDTKRKLKKIDSEADVEEEDKRIEELNEELDKLNEELDGM